MKSIVLFSKKLQTILPVMATFLVSQWLTASASPAISLGEALDIDYDAVASWTTSGAVGWIGQSAVTYDGIDAAQVGGVSDADSSSLQTVVAGPRTLSFRWKVSSEFDKDQLRFFIDGGEQAHISGEVNWQQATFNIPSGLRTLEWRYSKNGSLSSGQDMGWVDQVQFIPSVNCSVSIAPTNRVHGFGAATGAVAVATSAGCSWNVVNTNTWLTILSPVANVGSGVVNYSIASNSSSLPRSGVISIAGQPFTVSQSAVSSPNTAISLSEALDTVERPFVWSTVGAPAWIGQNVVSHDGVDAAEIGAVADSTAATLQTSVTGPGTLQFWWKVSSEADKDYLKFYMDGVQQTRISGELDWQLQSTPLGTGTHILKWTYAKNASGASGQDRGWVDEVSFSQGTNCTFAVLPANRLHGFGVETGLVSVVTATGCNWAVSNTSSWVSVTSPVNNGGSGTVVYQIASNPFSLDRSAVLSIAGVSFTIVQAGSPTFPPTITISALSTNSGATLLVQGSDGHTNVIECSTDLIQWTPISTNVTHGDPCPTCPGVFVSDPAGTNAVRRFYRVLQLP
jgi:Putative binding domain, N-terminal